MLSNPKETVTNVKCQNPLKEGKTIKTSQREVRGNLSVRPSVTLYVSKKISAKN